MHKEKKYTVIPTVNGFIVMFDHEDRSYSDINKRVALTLESVVEIIGNDLKTITPNE